MAYVAQQPILESLYALLSSNAGVAAAATGSGVQTDVLANPILPFLWLEYVDETDRRGFGTGGLPEIRVRTHAFSSLSSLSEAQQVNQAAVAALRDVSLTVEGYRQCGQVIFDRSIPLGEQLLDGVKVHEIVSEFRIYVEE